MTATAAASLERGAFMLSLDFELIWGTLDLFGTKGFERACEIERSVVVRRLVDLLEEFEIPATWCVLGHLLLDRCAPQGGRMHPEIVRPSHAWAPGDWFARDPGGTEATAPLFLGRSLVEMIRACRVPQEIACHSFSHVIFGDPGCSAETAASEIKACVDAAFALGIRMRSFAFPRNRVGHLEILRDQGFEVYRGPGPLWYEQDENTGWRGRIAHLWDVIRAATPPTVLPVREGNGLWNVPGSMIYFPMHGVRRFIPMQRRVQRAFKGLQAAAESKRVFHLWFHPTNLAEGTVEMFDGLRSIFERAAALRRAGTLDIVPMEWAAGSAERFLVD